MVVLLVLTLLVALAALVVALVPGVADALPGASSRRRPDGVEEVPADVAALRAEVAALRAEAHGSLRHLAVVRYDAFGGVEGTGGRLSWSVALTDDTGSGVVLTSITGRNEVRSYAKQVVDWAGEQPLSPEEAEAVAHARP